MSLMTLIGLALTLGGIAATLTSYARAPVSDQFSGWNLAFMGGISLAALGGLGILLSAMTG
ncbi:hypothetical protein Q8W71_32160 [Methylobacterium sp. NEAU 140]|uniref:hypothetical protein n=1 Tax=Methylobacterium sp. NEAU 140 TaxID=3064945 RepID=UPI002733C7D0|nr:hypothetical protein [Methylobacterium sp. NEAU 140]MDP4027229.1 hypothetical protein [Methylobacterium sp. NEAU 140]